MRSPLTVFIALALLLGACGDSDGPEETTPVGTDSETTTDSGGTAAEGEPVAVSLDDDGLPWTLTAPTELTAGSLTFEIENVGGFPHEFGITKGASYEDLPQTGSGAIDEDALGDDLIGITPDVIDSGESGMIEFDLEPGEYVFFCNIDIAGNSHANKGQVLSVTVS